MTLNSYDVVLYPGNAFPQTHPDRLATIALLFGMQPGRVDRCRVLEIGCGSGDNLIPMAVGLPQSEFVGIDLAALPIKAGQEKSAALGLRNIRLLQMDIQQVTQDLGRFDYIACHGVYSWVSPPARDAIMAACQSLLEPQGVAYISYDVYPGAYVHHMTREMMIFHVRRTSEPEQRIREARELGKILIEGSVGSDIYDDFLRAQLERVLSRGDSVLYHDDLEADYAPVYFHQFAEHAARYGLQFLSEADFHQMNTLRKRPLVAEALKRFGGDDAVLREQYFDYFFCRNFRRSLLCHQSVSLDRSLGPERARLFIMSSPARPQSKQPEINTAKVEVFKEPKGAGLSTGQPLAKAALVELGRAWPAAMSFDELLGKACAALGPEAPPDNSRANELGEVLLLCYASNLVNFHVRKLPCVTKAGRFPRVSALAQQQIARGSRVTDLLHSTIEVENPLARRLLALLDGTRDRAALSAELVVMVSSGEVTLYKGSEEISDLRVVQEMAGRAVEDLLAELARLALLEA